VTAQPRRRKCICVQRINQARVDSKREERSIRDGEIVSACGPLPVGRDRLRQPQRSGQPHREAEVAGA
jgi:hypothetical protein